jgi:hypothetical protein
MAEPMALRRVGPLLRGIPRVACHEEHGQAMRGMEARTGIVLSRSEARQPVYEVLASAPRTDPCSEC